MLCFVSMCIVFAACKCEVQRVIVCPAYIHCASISSVWQLVVQSRDILYSMVFDFNS